MIKHRHVHGYDSNIIAEIRLVKLLVELVAGFRKPQR